MTSRTRDKDFARRLQIATGQPYTRCLNAVRAELSSLVAKPEVEHYGHACSLLHKRLDAGEVLGLTVLPP